MQLKLFIDLLAALGKVVSGLKAIANLSKAERAKYHQVMDDTYRLIETTLNMVIIGLCDIQAFDNDHNFIQEVTKLDNYADWMQAEREFMLCKSLRCDNGPLSKPTNTDKDVRYVIDFDPCKRL